MSFDFEAVRAPFRMQPGLGRVAPGAAQLHPTGPTDGAHVEKLAVLREAPERALCASESVDARAALAVVAAEAAGWHPADWHWDGDAATAVRLGWRVSLDGALQPAAGASAPDAATGSVLQALPARWRFAALLALAFEEDLALVDARDGSIPWLAVCLPSHWSPQEKVGLPFTEVHAPVADNRLVLQAAPHLLRLVSGDERWQRYVWTVSPDPRLDGHPQRPAPRRWPDGPDAEDVDAVWSTAHWRTEHQTFIPLPAQRRAVFTIRVAVRPLAEAIDTPGRAQQLDAALASMSPAVLAYRGFGAVLPALRAGLARHAAALAAR